MPLSSISTDVTISYNEDDTKKWSISDETPVVSTRNEQNAPLGSLLFTLHIDKSSIILQCPAEDASI